MRLTRFEINKLKFEVFEKYRALLKGQGIDEPSRENEKCGYNEERYRDNTSTSLNSIIRRYLKSTYNEQPGFNIKKFYEPWVSDKPEVTLSEPLVEVLLKFLGFDSFRAFIEDKPLFNGERTYTGVYHSVSADKPMRFEFSIAVPTFPVDRKSDDLSLNKLLYVRERGFHEARPKEMF